MKNNGVFRYKSGKTLLFIQSKNPHKRTVYAVIGGGPEETRTPGLCDANAALYQLSYGPK